ncbi:hypothetical protein [Undibacterium sp. Tian12W]|uniref:hypothetical protein n=1 Tax=Undibacterium sp. Tian12W TaxID=3413054 RepID=UPI003BF34FD0
MKKTSLRHNARKISDSGVITSVIQPATTVLDFIIKAGAVSILPGAILVYYYLNSIGFKHFFNSTLGLQSGLVAVILAFGLFLLTLTLLLALNPWLIWSFKRAIGKSNAEEYFSFRNICNLNIAYQASLLALSVLGAPTYSISIAVILIPFIAVFQHGAIKLDLSVKTLYGIGLLVSLLGPIFLWIFLVPIVEDLSKLGTSSTASESVQIFIMLFWIVFYSLFVAFLTTESNKNVLMKEYKMIRNALFAFGPLLLALMALAPKPFVYSAMYSTGIRETSKDSRWYFIEKISFQKMIPEQAMSDVNALVNQVKELKGNIYLCGYSPFSASERFILCPSTVTDANPNQCPIVTIQEARPIPKPVGELWKCGNI